MASSLLALEDSRKELLARHGYAVIGAVATESLFFYPMDTLKTLLQVSANAGKGLGVSAVIEGIGESSGFAGLYGGVGWQVLGRLPGLGVRFGVYELVTAFFADGRGSENYVSNSEAFLAGLMAGALESFVSTPFDFLKVRAQITTVTSRERTPRKALFQPKLAKFDPTPLSCSSNAARWEQIKRCLAVLPGRSPNFLDSLKEYPWLTTGSGHPPLVKDVGGLRGVVHLEGWKAIWRGLRPSVFRDAIYGGTFFCSWQYLDDLVTEWKAYYMDPPPRTWEDIGPSSPLQLSMTAGIAGALAATASHSFDSAKSRSQATVVPKYLAMERTLLKWKTSGSWFEKLAGFSPFDRPLLSRGIGVRALQHGLGTFALVLTYHTTLQTLMAQKKASLRKDNLRSPDSL